MRRKLLQFPSLIAQHALRGAPKPRPQPQPQPHHHRFLHSPSAPALASPSPSPSSAHLLWNRLSGVTGASLLPRTAADVAAASARTAASRWLAAARGAGSLDLFSLQRRRRASWWQFSSSTFLQGSPWAYWMDFALMLSLWGLRKRAPVVWMLIGANVAVFRLWSVADPEFMIRHFTVSLDNFESGRLHTLLTSAFSHAKSNHLFTNMFSLYFFGNSIANVFGPAFLLKLYVGGALARSVFFLLEKDFLAHQKRDDVVWDGSRAPGHGASAAVTAAMLLHIFLYPKGLVYLYFLIPVPAALMGATMIVGDLFWLKMHGVVSGSAQLGGALVAALVWARIRKGWI